ncbi:hypothetical protein EJ03DRAFT_335908 [Teratosphaeria nubilosa]|uniref:Uncharacterized protein n=1 Tax=Teratosphaeria nubilosa TaxID=161662 RepID=A0A6G1LA72_9PEZI|nr:hypothetical protein EJ03DRAFT_335908 [Teratosphaeria nubilosa]
MSTRTTRSQTAEGRANASGTEAVPPNQLPPEHGTETNSGGRGRGGRGRGGRGRGGTGRGGGTNVSSAPQPAQPQGDIADAAAGADTGPVAPTDTATAQPNTGGQMTNGSTAQSGSKRRPDASEDEQDPKRQKVDQGEDRQQDTSAPSDQSAACENHRNVLRELRNSAGSPTPNFVPIPFGRNLALDWVFEANATVTKAIAEIGGLEAPSRAPTGFGSGPFYQDAVDMINLARRGEVSSDLIRNFLACYSLIAAHSVVPDDRSFHRTMPFGNPDDVAERAARIRLESELNTILPNRGEYPDLQNIIETCILWKPDRLGILWTETGHNLITVYREAVETATAMALSAGTSWPQQTSSEGGQGQPLAVNGSSNDPAGTSGDSEAAPSNSRASNAEQDVPSSDQTSANAQTNDGAFDGPAATSNGSARAVSSDPSHTQARSSDGSELHGPSPAGELTNVRPTQSSVQPGGGVDSGQSTVSSGQRGDQALAQSEDSSGGQANSHQATGGLPNEVSSAGAGAAHDHVPAVRASREQRSAPPGPLDGGFPRTAAEEEMQRVHEAYTRVTRRRPTRRRASSVEAEPRGDTRPASPTPAQIFRGIIERGDMPETDEHAARMGGDATGFLDEPYPEARLGIQTRNDTTETRSQRDTGAEGWQDGRVRSEAKVIPAEPAISGAECLWDNTAVLCLIICIVHFYGECVASGTRLNARAAGAGSSRPSPTRKRGTTQDQLQHVGIHQAPDALSQPLHRRDHHDLLTFLQEALQTIMDPRAAVQRD